MKKKLLFISLLLLTACSNNVDNTFSVYEDFSEVTTKDYLISVNDVRTTTASNNNYYFTLNLSIKNISKDRKVFELKNASLVRESTGATYNIDPGYGYTKALDSEIENQYTYTSIIPTSLNEHYYFSIDLAHIHYKVFLYETPDELREDLTVKYVVNSQTVHEEKVKKGRTLPTTFTYDSADHQTYASTWKDSSGKYYSKGTVINDNVTLTGVFQNNYEFMSLQSDKYAYIKTMKHIPLDGKVVIPDNYQTKPICISLGVIYNDLNIYEVYLPASVHSISINNFSGCRNLKTIYYAGTQSQWDLIDMFLLKIPESVNIVYDTPFTLL